MIKKLCKVRLLLFYTILIIIGCFFIITNREHDTKIIDKYFCNVTKVAALTETLKGEEPVVVGEDFNFDHDSIALLHIQKTGGTAWEEHIFKHLSIKINETSDWRPACHFNVVFMRYECLQNVYKFQIFWDRYQSIYCDPHADYTELKNCVMHEYKNRIISRFFAPSMKGIVHFITFLRDPVHRYVSEYNHVSNGATWSKAVRTCSDEKLYSKKCFKGDSWKDLKWESFLECDYNLAKNRQVRMLANYNILGCSALKCWTKETNCSAQQREFYEQKLLQSAKHTLTALSFFGLTEYPTESEYLFQKTFNEKKFKFNTSLPVKTGKSQPTQKLTDKIREINKLDLKLYEFAKDLFFKRIKHFRAAN